MVLEKVRQDPIERKALGLDQPERKMHQQEPEKGENAGGGSPKESYHKGESGPLD